MTNNDEVRRLRKRAETGIAQAQYELAYYLASQTNAEESRKECLVWFGSRSFPNSPSPLNGSIARRQLEHAHCIVVKDSFPMLARDSAFVGFNVGFHGDEGPVAAEH